MPNDGVDAAARIKAPFAGSIKLRNRPPPLASDLLGAFSADKKGTVAGSSRESDALLFHQSGEVKHLPKLRRVRSRYR
jgi:hypothetical protein